MNSIAYKIAGVLLTILGLVGIYYINEAPGWALFGLIALIGGIGMIAKATGKF
jgi:hypothetical protein